jgi:hypothetical protein
MKRGAPPMRSSRMLFGLLLALLVSSSAGAAQKQKSSETIWYERIEAGCKSDAKKYYSAIQFKKRRAFVKHCMDRVYR